MSFLFVQPRTAFIGYPISFPPYVMTFVCFARAGARCDASLPLFWAGHIVCTQQKPPPPPPPPPPIINHHLLALSHTFPYAPRSDRSPVSPTSVITLKPSPPAAVTRTLASKGEACAFGLQKASKRASSPGSPSNRNSVAGHRCGRVAAAFSEKVATRAARAACRAAARAGEKGRVMVVVPAVRRRAGWT